MRPQPLAHLPRSPSDTLCLCLTHLPRIHSSSKASCEGEVLTSQASFSCPLYGSDTEVKAHSFERWVWAAPRLLCDQGRAPQGHPQPWRRGSTPQAWTPADPRLGEGRSVLGDADPGEPEPRDPPETRTSHRAARGPVLLQGHPGLCTLSSLWRITCKDRATGFRSRCPLRAKLTETRPRPNSPTAS